MADLNDQAQAIWKTLDQMLEKDPEGYKKFIAEQMESSAQMFAAQKKDGKNPMVNFAAMANPLFSKNSKNANNIFGKVPDLPVKVKGKEVTGSSSKSVAAKSKKKDLSPVPKSGMDLTDDVFTFGNMLGTICNEAQNPDEDEADDIILKDFKLPGQKTVGTDDLENRKSVVAGKNKCLIQEL